MVREHLIEQIFPHAASLFPIRAPCRRVHDIMAFASLGCLAACEEQLRQPWILLVSDSARSTGCLCAVGVIDLASPA